MIARFSPDRWKPPITAYSGRSGRHSRACVSTFTTPACEHAVNTTTALVLHRTARKRSSMISGSGSQSPSRGAPHLAGQSGLVCRHARDLAAQVEHAVEQELRLAACSTTRRPPSAARPASAAVLRAARRRPAAVGRAPRTCRGAVAVGTLPRPPCARDQFERLEQAAAVVPVAVRQHHRLDGAEVDAEDASPLCVHA